MQPATREAYELFHKGSLALARTEANGIRVDVPYLKEAVQRTEIDIREAKADMQDDPVWKEWRRIYGANANTGSTKQIGHIVYDVLGHPCTKRTKSGAPAVDEKALQKIKLPFFRQLNRVAKLEKALSTYLKPFLAKQVNGYLHPSFALNLVSTFRSQSSDPNFQNIPNRDKIIARLIRRTFIPRDGHVITENDFGGIEVCVSACYHEDPMMIKYITDPSTDMHRDMAGQIFKLTSEQITKAIRFTAKGAFVFAEFYGDWWYQVAKNIWGILETDNICLKDGRHMYEHLKQELGITELGEGAPRDIADGTFRAHVRDIEANFWNERFAVYAAWKDQFFAEYEENGYFISKTGFRVHGPLSKNQIVNSPIQGSAFHCLLWCFIKIDEWLRKHNMKTKLVGQIHDSVVGDVHRDEVDDYLGFVQELAEKNLPAAWRWIIVPMTIETEVCHPEATWFDKQEVPVCQGCGLFHAGGPEFCQDGDWLEELV